MSTNTALDQIKKRAEINQHLGKTASQDEARDTLKLIAALEAVEAMAERFAVADSDLYDDDFNKGHCAGYRTAARLTRQAIEEALR